MQPNDAGYHTATEGAQAEPEEELSLPTYENLQTLVDELSLATGDILRKRRVAQIVLQDQALFLRKLKDIFETSEELNSQENLFSLFFIYKYMLSLGDTKIIETLFSQDYYVSSFGALECKSSLDDVTLSVDDPDLCAASSPTSELVSPTMRHRDFLQSKAKYKTLVKIESPQVLGQIHLVYRLNYLKDTAIARFIDDSVLQNINSLVYMNSTDIVNYIF